MDTNRNNIAGFEVLTTVTRPCSLVSPPTFQRTVLLPSLGSKSMPRKKPARSRQQRELLPDYTAYKPWLLFEKRLLTS
jgi:hypothetical protein